MEDTVPQHIRPLRQRPAEASFDPPLLHGRISKDVLIFTDISADDRKCFESVIAKFDSFSKYTRTPFLSARNSTVAATDNETAENSITNFYQMVESCDYGALQDQMLHNCIVAGI